MRMFGHFPSQPSGESASSLAYNNHNHNHNHHYTQSSTSSPPVPQTDSPEQMAVGAGTEQGSPSSLAPSFGASSGPPIRPLDYSAIISPDDLLAQLTHTVEDLAQWLAIVEGGLGAVLEGPHFNLNGDETSIIPEDQEEEEEEDDERFEMISPSEHLKNSMSSIEGEV